LALSTDALKDKHLRTFLSQFDLKENVFPTKETLGAVIDSFIRQLSGQISILWQNLIQIMCHDVRLITGLVREKSEKQYDKRLGLSFITMAPPPLLEIKKIKEEVKIERVPTTKLTLNKCPLPPRHLITNLRRSPLPPKQPGNLSARGGYNPLSRNQGAFPTP